MKVLILDDEPPARRSLRHALNDIGVTDVREASSIELAVKAIEAERPDLMLLDVELRGGKQGFDLLDTLPADGIPVIFVTAHPEHAVRAFERRAVDYLLKPVNPQRLKESLQRVSAEEAPAGQEERIFLRHETAMFRDGSKNVLVRIGDIQALEANDSYTRLVLADGKGPMVSGTLKSVLERIDPDAFFQADRGKAINLDHISSIEDGKVGLVAVMTNGTRVEMSRRQSAEFRELKGI
jgi:two-component system LytT family response regulator